MVRKLEPFLRFLEVAGILNGQYVNAENIASEARVPRSNVDVYFSILQDTLLGYLLPSYRPRAKVREQAHPKFYWFDPGVARGAAGLLNDDVDSVWYGTALETLIYHELRVYSQASRKMRPISYYRTGNTVEIDFVVETRKRTSTSKPSIVCIEVKHSKHWDTKWEMPMRSLAESDRVKVKKMFGVYMGATNGNEFGG
jgi:predicted AAA+ superfamily ATPase